MITVDSSMAKNISTKVSRQVFFGSNSYDDYTMVSFTEPILAEFIRIHPFRAESKYGPEEFAMMRVGVIACYQKGELFQHVLQHVKGSNSQDGKLFFRF